MFQSIVFDPSALYSKRYGRSHNWKDFLWHQLLGGAQAMMLGVYLVKYNNRDAATFRRPEHLTTDEVCPGSYTPFKVFRVVCDQSTNPPQKQQLVEIRLSLRVVGEEWSARPL